jgi:TM2 domain-containing membrane protein YozV
MTVEAERTYTIAQNGAVLGEYTLEQLEMMWRQNEIGQHTSYRHPCGQWKPLAHVIVPRLQSQAKAARATMKPSIGMPTAMPMQGPIGAPQIILVKAQRSRGVYIALGILLGGLGIHNFYAGYLARGIIELLCTLILGALFPLAFVGVMLWVLLELFTTDKDGDGHPLA